MLRVKLWQIIALSLALFLSGIHKRWAVQAQDDQQDEEETDPGGEDTDATENEDDQHGEEGEGATDDDGGGDNGQATDDEGTEAEGDEDEGADEDTEAEGEEENDQAEEEGDEGGDKTEDGNNTEDEEEGEEEGEDEEEGEEEGEEEEEEEEGKGQRKRKRGQAKEGEEEEGEEEEEEEEGEEREGQRKRKRGQASTLELLRCQDKNGNFLPIATVCQNRETKDFCERVFPSRDTNSHGRPRNCDLPGLKEAVYGCAHHCKVCCELKEHGCGDDSGYQINCAAQRHLCKNMTAMMSTTCASTCGLCATGACADTQDGCIGLRHMCDQKEFEEDMQKCARTCKFCTPKCADLTNDCQIADESSCEPPPPDHLEVNPYYEEMAKVCRKRCHLCDKAMPLNKRIAKKVADRAKRINDGLSDEEMNA